MAGFIKSVQKVDLSIAAAGTSGTAAINAVDTSKAICVWRGNRSAAGAVYSADQDSPRADLTSTTLVTLQTNSANALAARTAKLTVVEFAPKVIRSVQRGTIVIAANSTTGTAAIADVRLENAVPLHLGQTTNGALDDFGKPAATLSMTKNVVTATRGVLDAANTCTVSYEVLEFESGVISKVQQAQAVISSGTSGTVAIATIDINNSLCFFGGAVVLASSNDTRLRAYAQLSASVVTATRNLSSATGSQINVTVVTFPAGNIKSINRNTTTLGATIASVDTAITAVDTNFSFDTFLGQTEDVFLGNINSGLCSTELTSSTNLQVARTSGGSTATMIVSWEVAELTEQSPGMQGMTEGFSNFYDGTIDPGMHKIEQGICCFANDNEPLRRAA